MATRREDMTAHECGETGCECAAFQWNGRSYVLAKDEPYTCTCTHRASQHRYRVTK